MLADLLEILAPKPQTVNNSLGGSVTVEAPSAAQFRDMLAQLREALNSVDADQADGAFALRKIGVDSAGQGEHSLLAPDAARQLAVLFQSFDANNVMASADAADVPVQNQPAVSSQDAQMPLQGGVESALLLGGTSEALRSLAKEMQQHITVPAQSTAATAAGASALTVASGLFDGDALAASASKQLDQLHDLGKLQPLMQQVSAQQRDAIKDYFSAKNINISVGDVALAQAAPTLNNMPETLKALGLPANDAALSEEQVAALKELQGLLQDILGADAASAVESLHGSAAQDTLQLAMEDVRIPPVIPAVEKGDIDNALPLQLNDPAKVAPVQPALADEQLKGDMPKTALTQPMAVGDAVANNAQTKAVNPFIAAAKPLLVVDNAQPAPVAQDGIAAPLATAKPIALDVPTINVKHMPSTYQPPADQIVVSMRQAIANGDDTIRIKLKPAELGRVDVQMTVNKDGHAQMRFVVENPDTLDLLQKDSRNLLKMLEDVGIKSDSKQLSFSLNQQGGQHAGQQGEGSNGRGQHDGAQAELDALLEHEPVATAMRHQLYQLQLDTNIDIEA